METFPSICIPRVFSNITKRDVVQVFEHITGKGSIDRVDMVYRKDGNTPYQRVFIHFNAHCKTTEYVEVVKERFKRGKDVKIVYSEPWIWKCSLNRLKS